MSQPTQNQRPLGRGLDALLGENSTDKTSVDGGFLKNEIVYFPINSIQAGQFQPRQHFDMKSLNELANSILEEGILQPLIVRPLKSDPETYEIIAGERRYRAAQIAGLADVPVVIREMSDKEALQIAIIENVQRQDLNPIEEAQSYKKLGDVFSYTQEEIAKLIGKSRSYIANQMRLLTLPMHIQNLINENKISPGHARAMINLENPEQLAQKIVNENLSVRDIEGLKKRNVERFTAKQNKGENEDIKALEAHLFDLLQLPVQIKLARSGGEIILKFKNLHTLDQLIARLAE